MKREIKFRGKRLGNGEWVYGSLLWNEHAPAILSAFSSVVREVAPDTIGQFIGLCYKDGKEIYEGDIVRVTDDEYFTYEDGYARAVVIWADWDASFVMMIRDGYLSFEDNLIAVAHLGNIHDNPELIKS